MLSAKNNNSEAQHVEPISSNHSLLHLIFEFIILYSSPGYFSQMILL